MKLTSLRSFALGAVGIVAIGLLSAQAQVPGVNSTLNAVFNLVYDNSTMKPSYTALRTITPASSATDFCALSGSASKNVRIRRVSLTGAAATFVGEPVALIKRSTAPTGAGSQVTPIPYDSSNTLAGTATNVATAVFEYWAANPTVGTAVGVVADPIIRFGGSTPQTYITTFGELASPIVLRGVAESLAINLNGVTVTGTITCQFEWTEE